MADAAHHRGAPEALDGIPHGPARPNVVDDRAARLLLQHRLGEQRRHEVSGDELAGVVHEEAAVGVTVEGDPEVCSLLLDLGDDELAVLDEERVRLVVGEAAVRFEEAGNSPHGKALEDRRQHLAAHAVRGVDHDAQGADGLRIDERQHLVDEARIHVPRLGAPRGCRPAGGLVRDGERAVADVEEPGVGADRKRASAHDLRARVLLRIVGCGDRGAAVEPELADGVVEHLGPDHPDVDDFRARFCRPANERLMHRGRREPHVPADRDRLGLELLGVGATYRVGAGLVELGRIDPSDVVCLEDLRL